MFVFIVPIILGVLTISVLVAYGIWEVTHGGFSEDHIHEVWGRRPA